MKVARLGILAVMLASVVVWMWAHEPDSSALRNELITLSRRDGLALACFYSTPATLIQFDRRNPALLRTAEFGFAGVSPDGGHLFVSGPKDAFSGLENFDGTPVLAIAGEVELQRAIG